MFPRSEPLLPKTQGFIPCSGSTLGSPKAMVTELQQSPEICIVPNFSYEELYKTLAGPTIKILDRNDFRSVIKFLLMKLHSALDSDWLSNLPELRKVILLL